MELEKVVERVLLRNGWAIVLKGNPIASVPVQGESDCMFKLNLIENDRLLTEIKQELETQTEIQEYKLWKKDIGEGND